MDTSWLPLFTGNPAALGRAAGFTLLRDRPHNDWLRRMILSREDLTILAHRGSYKTTCLSLALAVLMCLEPARTLMLLRKTDADIGEVIRQVRGILSSPALASATAALWGQPVRILRATRSELTASCYTSPRGAVQLHGQGIGGSLTGRHADIIFTDDIVNLSDRLSPAERRHTISVYQELQNIRNPGGRLVNTGTPWHPEDAVSLMPNVLRADCYTTGLLSPSAISGLRQSMSPSLFSANYELRHIPEADALFPDPPRMAPDDPALLSGGIAHLDAAYGGSDFTALTLGRKDGETVFLLGRLWEGHVDRHLDEIVRLCLAYGCSPVHCEVNGDKGYLARALRARGLPVRPYAERMHKFLKISTFLRAAFPSLRFLPATDPAYLRQIASFTEHAAHDDAPDSAACLVRALSRSSRLTL